MDISQIPWFWVDQLRQKEDQDMYNELAKHFFTNNEWNFLKRKLGDPITFSEAEIRSILANTNDIDSIQGAKPPENTVTGPRTALGRDANGRMIISEDGSLSHVKPQTYRIVQFYDMVFTIDQLLTKLRSIQKQVDALVGEPPSSFESLIQSEMGGILRLVPYEFIRAINRKPSLAKRYFEPGKDSLYRMGQDTTVGLSLGSKTIYDPVLPKPKGLSLAWAHLSSYNSGNGKYDKDARTRILSTDIFGVAGKGSFDIRSIDSISGTRNKTRYELCCDEARLLQSPLVSALVAISQGLWKVFFSRQNRMQLHTNDVALDVEMFIPQTGTHWVNAREEGLRVEPINSPDWEQNDRDDVSRDYWIRRLSAKYTEMRDYPNNWMFRSLYFHFGRRWEDIERYIRIGGHINRHTHNGIGGPIGSYTFTVLDDMKAGTTIGTNTRPIHKAPEIIMPPILEVTADGLADMPERSEWFIFKSYPDAWHTPHDAFVVDPIGNDPPIELSRDIGMLTCVHSMANAIRRVGVSQLLMKLYEDVEDSINAAMVSSKSSINSALDMEKSRRAVRGTGRSRRRLEAPEPVPQPLVAPDVADVGTVDLANDQGGFRAGTVQWTRMIPIDASVSSA